MAKKEIKGLRGWLLLFVIISVISLISLAYELYNNFFIYLWSGLIGKIILVSAFMSLLLTLIYLILIFKKSSFAVAAVITALLYDTAVNFSIFILLLNISPTKPSELYLSSFLIIFNLVWIFYFNFSRRVRNTFN